MLLIVMSHLHTIGHGNRKAGDFIMLLKANGITILIDVRSVPFSRFHPQFTQKNLKVLLEQNSIEYVFMGDSLGGWPSDASLLTGGKPDYQKMAHSPGFKRGISVLKEMVEQNNHIVIMCSESSAAECHRTKLIAENIYQEITIRHIDKDGKIRSQQEVMNSTGMHGLFA